MMRSSVWSYAGTPEDEKIIVDKCGRCLEVWEDISMGIATEKDFEKERDALYRIVVRVAESDVNRNWLVNSHPDVLKIGRIRTKKDKQVKNRMIEIMQQANALIGGFEPPMSDLSKAATLLNEAEKISHYLSRPLSLYEIGVSVSDGKRTSFLIRREF